MRIIAGSAKGRKIEAPEGLDTRPVTDKIRGSLFNIWQFDIPGSSFLDLFSGSGSMGLEALSRQADKAVMVEKSPRAAAVIRSNLAHTHLSGGEVIQDDVFSAIKRLDAAKDQFDFIYLDPPYTVDSIFEPVMEAVGNSQLLKEDGMLVIRTRKEKEMADEYGNLEKFREKTYGISKAHFYRKKDQTS